MTLHTIESTAQGPSVDGFAAPPPSLGKSLMRFTAQRYHRLIEADVVPEGGSTELLTGLIVWKDQRDSGDQPMGHGPEHALVISLLVALAVRINGPRRHLRIQLPVAVGPHDEPEPDASIVLGQPRDFADHLPAPADVVCIIEVAGSSLNRDREDKLPIYAAAGIPQYIILNLEARAAEVYSNPDGPGARYRGASVFPKGQNVPLNLGLNEFLEVPAAELLP